MLTRRLFATSALLTLTGCAALSREEIKIRDTLVSDFELCKSGLEHFMDNIDIEAKAKFKDFQKLIAARVAFEFADNEIKKRAGNPRAIIRDILFYIEDAAVVADFILTYVPAPFPIPLIVKAIKTLDPVIADLVGRIGKDKVINTGMTVAQARAILSSLPPTVK